MAGRCSSGLDGSEWTVRRSALRAFGATVTALLAAAFFPASAGADPILVFPGMEIHQGPHLCTLGYVDPGLRVAFSAGHCHADGAVFDKDNKIIGNLATFRDNTPNGSVVQTSQQVDDYEAIVLTPDVAVNNILPGGRVLQSDPGLVVTQGEPICHFGVATGETCGTVESVNNGWFTMGHGVISQQGDSGGPVYLVDGPGPARIVGIFNSVWGGFPAAVSWQSATQQIRQDVGVGGPAI
jgi:hypothetical protein